MIQGAIAAASNPAGMASGAVRGNDMIHLTVRAQRTHAEEFYELRPISAWSVDAVNREARAWPAEYAPPPRIVTTLAELA